MDKSIAIISTILGVITAFISLYKESYGIYSNREDEYRKVVLEPFYLSVMKDKEKIPNVRDWLKESYMLLPSKIAITVNDNSVDDLEILKMLIVDYVKQGHTLENMMFRNLSNVFVVVSNISLIGVMGLVGYRSISLIGGLLDNLPDNMKLFSSSLVGILIGAILPICIVFFIMIPLLMIFFKCFRVIVKKIDKYSNITLKEAYARRKSDIKIYEQLVEKQNTLAVVFKRIYRCT